MTAARDFAAAIALACAAAVGVAAAAAPDSAPRPVGVADGVVAAFRDHRVVAITDPRTSATNSIVVGLLRDARFRERARVVVYDCCAPRFQPLIDRYVGGGDVPLAAVARAWARAGPRLPAPNLFVAARRLNRRLPAGERIRIVLAHPWASGTFVCVPGVPCNPWGDRLDRVIADVVEREVFANGRRALLLASHWKLDRRLRPPDPRAFGRNSAARIIDRRHPGALFIAWAMATCASTGTEADDVVASWPRPAIAAVRGTSVGAAPETLLWSCQSRRGIRVRLPPPDERRRVDADVDAILTAPLVPR